MANEIKELAQQTARATEEIKGNVQSIQLITVETVDEIKGITDEITSRLASVQGLTVLSRTTASQETFFPRSVTAYPWLLRIVPTTFFPRS